MLSTIRRAPRAPRTRAYAPTRPAQQRRAATTRSNAEHMELLRRELPPLYLESALQFEPVWRDVADAVRASPPPAVILDLASGPAEPACSLAERFPAAEVVASDNAPEMLAHARRRIDERGLFNIEVHQIDLMDLRALAEPGANPPACDV
eukprot:4491785-Prymnesium_polylepis.1